MTHYRACRDCTLALINDDYSHLDPDSPRFDDVRRGVTSAPLLAYVGPLDPEDCGLIEDCEVCGQSIYAEEWSDFEVATITGAGE